MSAAPQDVRALPPTWPSWPPTMRSVTLVDGDGYDAGPAASWATGQAGGERPGGVRDAAKGWVVVPGLRTRPAEAAIRTAGTG